MGMWGCWVLGELIQIQRLHARITKKIKILPKIWVPWQQILTSKVGVLKIKTLAYAKSQISDATPWWPLQACPGEAPGAIGACACWLRSASACERSDSL